MRRKWFAAALAIALLLCAGACAEVVENIMDQCQYVVNEGSGKNIVDDSMNTAWRPTGENPELRIKLPEGGAAYIQIHWSIPPTNYTLTEYDGNESVVATHTQDDDAFACIAELLPLNKETRYVFLSFHQSRQGVNKIRIFPEGELPKTVVKWEPPLEKCELMIISTHQDDEWLWFGPMIPYYDLVKKRDVQVMYMANCGRHRYAEALNALAVAGVRTFPLFLGLKDEYNNSVPKSIEIWGGSDNYIGEVVEQIRRFKPEIILTHDLMGEYGHPQHILTSHCMESAINRAADPDWYPESVEKYGVWQVKKLYRHLEKKGRIEFDWHVAYPEFGGRTGIQVAIDSMNENVTQTSAWHVEDHGEYDNSLFGLSWSAVGDDVLHEDLFENIDEPAAEIPAEGAPGADDAGADGEIDADDAGAEGEIEPEPEPAREGGGSAAPLIAAGAAAAVAAAGALVFVRVRAKRRRRRAASRAKKTAQRKARTNGAARHAGGSGAPHSKGGAPSQPRHSQKQSSQQQHSQQRSQRTQARHASGEASQK